jgi:hypothetical protein
LISLTHAQYFFSTERIARYLTAVGGDTQRAVQLYQLNLELSEAFYGPLAVLEIAVRNRLDAVLQVWTGQRNWLQAQQTGFMRHPLLTFTNARTGQIVRNDFLLKSVQKAERKVRPRLTHNRLVAELTFGFWTELFEPTHYRILAGRPLQIFPARPTTAKRVDIFTRLTRVRHFRNRIYHYEPVCFDGATIGLLKARQVHQDLQELCGWLRPELTPVLATLDRIETVCAKIDSLA